MNMLGSYSHCSVIANIDDRLEIYRSKDDDLLAVFENQRVGRTSHDYFYCTAEFVLASSKLVPSLWSWVVQHKNYRHFDNAVVKATDTMRNKLKPSRVMQIVAPRAWSAPASLHGLIAASSTRKKLNAAALQTDCATLARVYKESVLTRPRMGYSFNVVQVVGEVMLGIQNCATDAEQRTFCQALPVEEKAKLQAYCHGQTTQLALHVGVLSTTVADAQRHAVHKRSGFGECNAFVCLSCSTWRLKAPCTNRGTVGVQINVEHNKPWTFSCNLCNQSWGIRKVDMVGKLLCARFKLDGPSELICVCVTCGFLAVNPVFRGSLPYCASCATKRAFNTCFKCNREDRGDFSIFTASQRNVPTTFHACLQHVPRMHGLQCVPIHLLRTQVKYSHSVYLKKIHNSRKRKWSAP